MKCLKKIYLVSQSGAGASKTPTCNHFYDLLFIRDSVSNRPTESNIGNEEIVDDMAYSLQHTPSTALQNPSTALQTPAISPVPSTEVKANDGQLSSKKFKVAKKKESDESAEHRDQIDLLLAKALTMEERA